MLALLAKAGPKRFIVAKLRFPQQCCDMCLTRTRAISRPATSTILPAKNGLHTWSRPKGVHGNETNVVIEISTAQLFNDFVFGYLTRSYVPSERKLTTQQKRELNPLMHDDSLCYKRAILAGVIPKGDIDGDDAVLPAFHLLETTKFTDNDDISSTVASDRYSGDSTPPSRELWQTRIEVTESSISQPSYFDVSHSTGNSTKLLDILIPYVLYDLPQGRLSSTGMDKTERDIGRLADDILEKCWNQVSDVTEWLHQRGDYIPNLEDVLKFYAEHDSGTVSNTRHTE
jgi:hypothetical protein